MKKKYSRILGVVLVLALLASIFGIATPAAASDRAWSSSFGPSGVTFQVTTAKEASFIAVADNGTVFMVDTEAGTGAAAPGTDVVYKSTTAGAMWTASSVNPWAATAVTALAVSPAFSTDNTVIVAAGRQVYISTSGGAAFAALGGQVNPAVAGETISSLDIAPTYSGGGVIMAGTVDAGVGAANLGDVYLWGSAGTLNWTAQALNEDVTSVAFSPNYPLDATILAVGSDATPQTRLHTKVSTFAWDATIGGPANINLAGGVGDASAIVSSAIALPADYNGSSIFSRRAYVATVSGLLTDDIYRVTNVTAGVALNPTAAGDDQYASLAYSGDYTTGTLFAGNYAGAAAVTSQVMRTANPNAAAGILWYPASAAPTGTSFAAGPLTYVALTPDFATSNRIMVGTAGDSGDLVAGANDESAVSASDDGGARFYQTGMVDTTINHFSDVAVSPDYANDSTTYLVTASAAAGVAADGIIDSLWKRTGSTWSRIATLTFANNSGIVRLSPGYATDSTLVLAEIGAGALDFRLSNNAGSSFTARLSPVAINDLLVDGTSTLYVGNNGGGNVRKTVNAGWTWGAPMTLTNAGSVQSLAMAPNGDILAGANVGLVYRLSAGGTAFSILGAGIGAVIAAANVTEVCFDGNYDGVDNNYVYVAAAGNAGVARMNIGTDTAWALLDNAAVLLPVGLVTTPDGALYVADATAAAAGAGGIYRTPTPTAFIVAGGISPAFEWVSTGDGLTALDVLGNLVYTAGSNMVFAIETTGADKLVTYTDTLVGAPELTVGAVTAAVASFTWDAQTGARTYALQVNTRVDFLGTAQTIAQVGSDANGRATGLAGGVTYYARVRVATPVVSNWSATQTITTTLAAVAAPVLVRPLPASQDVTTTPSFSWAVVVGAASYTIEVADNTDFTDATTGSSPINAWQVPGALEYSTTYYWRVTAVSATGAPASVPVISVFTTMDEPAPVAPTTPPTIEAPDVTVDVAAPEVTVPPAEITVEPAPVTVEAEATPTWALLVIIIIGAVLVISVLILIIRTRRPV